MQAVEGVNQTETHGPAYIHHRAAADILHKHTTVYILLGTQTCTN